MKRNYKKTSKRCPRWVKKRKKQYGSFWKTHRLADITNKFNNFKRTAKRIVRQAFG